jgi:hypothetical protein
VRAMNGRCDWCGDELDREPDEQIPDETLLGVRTGAHPDCPRALNREPGGARLAGHERGPSPSLAGAWR